VNKTTVQNQRYLGTIELTDGENYNIKKTVKLMRE